MVIFAISGSGIGAGKTTLAKQLANPVWSLAGGLRKELSLMLPDYNWDNKSQEYKDKVKVHERGNKTIRQVMVEHGQSRCAQDPLYWVESLCSRLSGTGAPIQPAVVAIDDIRKINEIEHIRGRFPSQVVHFHVEWEGAIAEPEFENEQLKAVADYIIRRNR